MATADYPDSLRSSNSSFAAAAQHLELAGLLLEREAAERVSGRQARQLQVMADRLRAIAAILSERWRAGI